MQFVSGSFSEKDSFFVKQRHQVDLKEKPEKKMHINYQIFTRIFF